MRVFILGCGRVGAKLADLLDREGHEVTIMDTDPEAFQRLGRGFRGQVIVGIGIDEDALRKAGVGQSDAFVAVTEGDNTNVMASQIAQKIFQVPHVISQLKDPLRGDVFHLLGIETISPTVLGADQIRALVDEYAASMAAQRGSSSRDLT